MRIPRIWSARRPSRICKYGDTAVSLQRGEEVVNQLLISKYWILVNFYWVLLCSACPGLFKLGYCLSTKNPLGIRMHT